jgi:hypothetical protein
MVNKMINAVLFSILFLLASCNREMYPVDPTGLTYELKENNDSCFKQSRLYCCPINDSIIAFMYLFSNGASCYFATSESRACIISESIREIPYNWGRYRIQSDTLRIQMVDTHREPFEKFGIDEVCGLITNDSSFVMISRTRKNKVRKFKETYYLKACESMPESSSILDKY